MSEERSSIIAPFCQICATTVCGVEFTKGKRPGVRWGAELAPDSMGRAVIGSEKEDAYPWCNCEKQGIA